MDTKMTCGDELAKPVLGAYPNSLGSLRGFLWRCAAATPARRKGAGLSPRPKSSLWRGLGAVAITGLTIALRARK